MLCQPFDFEINDFPEYTTPDIATDKPRWLYENFIITILSVLLLLLIVYTIHKRKFAITIGKEAEKILISSVVFCFFIFIFVNKLSLFSDIVSYDNISVRAGAYGIMNNGVIPKSIQNYLLEGRNNRSIVLLLGLLGRTANDFLIPYRLLWIFIDSIFITLAVLFVYLTIKLYAIKLFLARRFEHGLPAPRRWREFPLPDGFFQNSHRLYSVK